MGSERTKARLSAEDALAAVVARHPTGRERPGQVAMLRAVRAAIAEGRHLLVEAGTGTGKSLAYLIPAVLATTGDDGARVVVATATKALQEQLVAKDLPFLAGALAEHGVAFRYAMLKGRANYLCVAKTAAAVNQLDLDDADANVEALAWWAWITETGDRSDFPAAVPDAVWTQVSTDAVECPGASNCAFGSVCFAEHARRRAASADVVVVNTHLFALDVESGNGILPAHDVVVLDEAHAVEDIAASAFGITLSPGRVRHLAGRVRRTLAESDLPMRLDAMAADLVPALAPHEGERVLPGRGDLAVAVGRLRDLVGELRSTLAGINPTEEDAVTRHQQVTRLAEAFAADLEEVLALTETGGARVAWVEGPPAAPLLRVAPVDVGPLLAGRLRPDVTVVATSATLAVAGDFTPAAWRLGFRDSASWRGVAVESPFDYASQALLYCALHLPDPRSPGFPSAMHEELATLVRAAGGRTLALFTSRAAMAAAAAAVAGAVDGIEVVTQDDAPRPELLRRMRGSSPTALFATQSFWQGVDIPGSDVLLVTIDKLPFPRPNDPLFTARREAARAQGKDAFTTVDLARAATLLAQGVGRLIRTDTDRGVVAVFDQRLALKSYAWSLVRSLPPMRRTRHLADATAFLADAAAEG